MERKEQLLNMFKILDCWIEPVRDTGTHPVGFVEIAKSLLYDIAVLWDEIEMYPERKHPVLSPEETLHVEQHLATRAAHNDEVSEYLERVVQLSKKVNGQE